MSELFGDSGQKTEDLAVSAPSMMGVLLPGMDRPEMIDGFGMVKPLGGGGTSRNYLAYGINTPSSAGDMQLFDSLNPSLSVGAGISYNFEGLVGPQGPPGPPGPAGVPGTSFGISGPSGLFSLDSTLEQIADLGTAVDQMIYTSAFEFTYTWTEKRPVGSVDRDFELIKCSDNGTFAVTIEYGGRLWLTSNSGDTWAEPGTGAFIGSSHNWNGLALDSDGSNIIAGYTTAGRLYTSSDFGAHWTERQPAGAVTYNWSRCASDSDGSFLVASGSPARLFTSANSGVTWTERQPAGDNNKQWRAAACDADGSVIVVGAYEGRLYKSSDSGVTWTELTPKGNTNQGWWGAAVSDNGQVIVVIHDSWGGTSGIWVSMDGGSTWVERKPYGTSGSYYWRDVAISATGAVIVVTKWAATGAVWISFDYGTTWHEENIAGQKYWTAVALSSAGDKGFVTVSDITNTGTVYNSTSYGVPVWSETTITPFARTLVDDSTPAEARTTLGLGTGDSPTFAGITLTNAVIIAANSAIFQPAVDSLTFLRVMDADGGTPIITVDSVNEWMGLGTDTPLRKFHLYDPYGSCEFLMERGDQGVDQKRFNIFLANNQTHFRALNDAGTGGVNWFYAIHSSGKVVFPYWMTIGAELTPVRKLYVTDAGGDAEFLLERTDQAVDCKRFNIFIANNKTYFRALNDAGDGGLTWLQCVHSTGEVTLNYSLVEELSLFLTEQAADLADRAGKGQIWVRNDTPNNLCFTDDIGVVYELSHNLTTDIDHDALTNFVAAEHLSLPNTIANVLSDHNLAAHTTLGLFDASSDVDHDQTTNFVANKHVDHSAVSILAGTGMSGGGDITASRTLNCSITQYTDALARAAISETITGISYDNGTGVFSLTSGYVIPTTTQETNWGTAYTHSQIAGGDSVHVSVTENSNWDAAYTHVSSTGDDHTWLNQDVTIPASPTFAGLELKESFVTTDTYTKLLLHFDGPDASTSIKDNSFSQHAPTVAGNAQIDTAQSKFGGSSCLFDGTGDYVNVPSSSDFNYGTGDFTIDCWIYINAENANNVIAAGVTSGNVGFGWNQTTGLWMGRSGIAADIYSAVEITLGTWHHVACTRASGTVRLFLDGVITGSGSWIYDCPTSAIYIGIDGDGASLPFNGWIDEFRISKGVARWTAAFTPPIRPYGDGTFGRVVTSEVNTSIITILERSSDPAQPTEGQSIIWMSDGTGYGDDGDLCIAGTSGGVTTKSILWDKSAGDAW